jgi:hypothetical protein
MNEHDRANLKFLLGAEAEVIRDWAGKMESDDIVYAQELLMQYAEELRQKSQEILVEAELARNPAWKEAKDLIDKVNKP